MKLHPLVHLNVGNINNFRFQRLFWFNTNGSGRCIVNIIFLGVTFVLKLFQKQFLVCLTETQAWTPRTDLLNSWGWRVGKYLSLEAVNFWKPDFDNKEYDDVK